MVDEGMLRGLISELHQACDAAHPSLGVGSTPQELGEGRLLTAVAKLMPRARPLESALFAVEEEEIVATLLLGRAVFVGHLFVGNLLEMLRSAAPLFRARGALRPWCAFLTPETASMPNPETLNFDSLWFPNSNRWELGTAGQHT